MTDVKKQRVWTVPFWHKFGSSSGDLQKPPTPVDWVGWRASLTPDLKLDAKITGDSDPTSKSAEAPQGSVDLRYRLTPMADIRAMMATGAHAAAANGGWGAAGQLRLHSQPSAQSGAENLRAHLT